MKSEMYYLRKFTDKANLIATIEEYINYYIVKSKTWTIFCK